MLTGYGGGVELTWFLCHGGGARCLRQTRPGPHLGLEFWDRGFLRSCQDNSFPLSCICLDNAVCDTGPRHAK